jgi:hypothetical protein
MVPDDVHVGASCPSAGGGSSGLNLLNRNAVGRVFKKAHHGVVGFPTLA